MTSPGAWNDALAYVFDHPERQRVAWLIAGTCALSASILSIIQIYLHVRWNQKNDIRKYILRILFMVPIYGLESWLGLRFKNTTMYFDTMRECYESLVIYAFYCFLVEVLGGERRLCRILRGKHPQDHLFPFCCLRPWTMGPEFFFKSKVGILQFVVLKPLMAVFSFAFNSLDMYYSGEISFEEAYIYIMFVDNISQTIAIYCLIIFYFAVKEELAPVRPVPKFLVVKSVVFFTFWQSVALTLLVKMGFITATKTYTADDVTSSLQDFLVCIEMFIAAMTHHYAFNYKEFYNPESARVARTPLIRSIFQAVNVTDVFVDDVEFALNPRRREQLVIMSTEDSPLLNFSESTPSISASGSPADRPVKRKGSPPPFELDTSLQHVTELYTHPEDSVERSLSRGSKSWVSLAEDRNVED